MKSFYPRFCKALMTLVLMLCLNNLANAQPHAPGDIAFTGYHSFPNDKFSFVLLKNFTAGQTINFTEAGWLPATNQFDSDEGLITWTVPAGGLVAGKELTVNLLTNTVALAGGGAAGTITVTTAIGLNDGGDQIFAFTGTKAAPTSILSGLHMNTLTIGEIFDACNTTNAAWDGACATGSNTYSGLPAAGGLNTLTGGTNALWIGNIAPGWHEWNNAKFNCAAVSDATLSTVAGLRAAVNNKANWLFNDDANPNTTTTIPVGCNWLGLGAIPVRLVSFTGKLNSDKSVTLQWKVEEQQDIREYIVEQSSNGTDFRQVGSVPATTATAANYSYIDNQVVSGNNYYRLKIMELSGKISYSGIALVKLKANLQVTLYPNPVKDKLTIQQFGTIQNKTAVLTDGHGQILQQLKLASLQQEINMKIYPPGIYMLKLEDGTVFRIIK